MATNLSIDPELIEQALELRGERTKKAAVRRRCRSLSRAGGKSACWSSSVSSSGTRATTTRLSASAGEPVRGHQGLIARASVGIRRPGRDREPGGRNLILPVRKIRRARKKSLTRTTHLSSFTPSRPRGALPEAFESGAASALGDAGSPVEEVCGAGSVAGGRASGARLTRCWADRSQRSDQGPPPVGARRGKARHPAWAAVSPVPAKSRVRAN